jgi:DNA-binding transcriptional MocR family regulator
MSVTPTTISFARGVPSFDMLPAAEIAEAPRACWPRTRRACSPTAGPRATNRSGSGSPTGTRPPSSASSSRTARSRGWPCSPSCCSPTRAGRAVVEAPTYDRTLLTLRRFGATVQSVALEGDGIDVDAFESRLTAGAVPGLVYLIPNFQNPAGTTMSRASASASWRWPRSTSS